MDILNLSQIIWQAINFLLLYLVIAKFVVPPTKKFLAKREHEIQSGIENADKVKKQLTDAQKSKDEILADARAEGSKIIEEMRKRADQMALKLEEEAKVAAQAEATRIIEQAREVAARDSQKVNEEIVRLASVIAKKSLGQSISLDLQHDLLKKNLEQLKSSKVVVEG
jgi:F-type H+-transporting ATPase subunit b